MKIERMMLPHRRTGRGEGYRVSADLAEALNLPGPSNANREHLSAVVFETCRQRPSKVEWRGGIPNLPEFREFYRKGWPEGVSRIRDAIGELPVPHLPSIRRRGCWGDDGDEIELSRIYSGELDRAWRTTRRVPDLSGRSQLVRLVVPVEASCSVEPGKLFWRPAIGAMIADAMEEAGYRTEIWTASMTGSHMLEQKDEPGAHLIRVKDFGEPLDLERLAVTAHAGWFRVVTFGLMLVMPETASDCLGIPLNGRPQDYASLFEDDSEGVKAIVVPGDILSREAAVAWVKKFEAEESSDE